MSEEREIKWLRVGDANVLLIHTPCADGSEIEVTYDSGGVACFVVPCIDKAGLPASAGEYPSIADMERLGTLLATYSKPFSMLGVDGRCRIAIEMNSDLTEASPGFAWLALLEKAEQHGVDIGLNSVAGVSPGTATI